MPPPFSRLLVCFALASSALAAGCGQARESDQPASASSAAQGSASRPITKTEFIAQADAICDRMNVESIAAAKQLKGRPLPEILARALAIQGKAIRELRALERPPGDEKQIGAVLLHLDRLQKISRMLDTEGEEILAVVAGIAVETDAVARAAHRYGMFRRCGAYHENPGVQKILREQQEEARALRGPDGKVLKPRAPRRPAVPEIRQLASALVPSGSTVLRRQDCAGGDPRSPSCVTIELSPAGSAVNERRAQIARLAERAGWTRLKLTGDRPNPTSDRPQSGVLVFHREGYDATVWLAGPDCVPQLQVGDGPNPTVSTRRCVDTIMVMNFR